MNNGNRNDQPKRFWSLRTKLVWFISLIIVGVCSGLSWYFVQQQADFMKSSLIKTGNLLLNNLAHNSRYSLIAQDNPSLERIAEGTMLNKEVVYVVVTGPTGKILVARTKGTLKDPRKMVRDVERPLFPDPGIAQQLLGTPHKKPSVKVFTTEKNQTNVISNRGKAGLATITVDQKGETWYDFARTVQQHPRSSSLFGPLSLEGVEEPEESSTTTRIPYGVIQVGLTNAHMLQTLNTLMWNVVMMTIMIIVIGITATSMLANRIITPLRRLVNITEQVAKGDLSVSVTTRPHDEIGQLTNSINQMTTALRHREQSISMYVKTITQQVAQLATLNQTGAAITSTLDLDKIFSSVLTLLSENLGFTRMLLVLYDPDRQVAYMSRMEGIPEEIQEQAKKLEIPIQDDEGLDAEVFIRGKGVLVQDIEDVAHRMYPPVLTLCRLVGVQSFVLAPLKCQDRVLGYLGGERGGQRSTEEDLNLLLTIANHVAVAIDNARTYRALTQLNLTLEQRVEDRTQALQSAIDRLQELDRLKSVFVSIVSHELRTPMTSIKGLIENMLDGLTGTLTDRQTFYLTRVKYNIERLTRMLNDLLDLSRIEAGRMELHPVAVSTTELVTEVAESLQGIAEEKSLTLRTHIAGTIPIIQGDRDKLHQVLTNLVSNAIKFTDSGGEVRIEAEMRTDNKIQIGIIDSGRGIPRDEQEKIFERFYRGHSTPVEMRGAGLGLAITKSLVELHGGQIWVESDPGEGTRFFITLPIP